jgi:hypothetical protein
MTTGKKRYHAVTVRLPNETYKKVRADAVKAIQSDNVIVRDIVMSYYEVNKTMKKFEKEA